MLGVDAGWSYFGTLRGRERWQEGGNSYSQLARQRDRVRFVDAFLRLQPASWPLRPYVEGVVGLKVVNTVYNTGSLLPGEGADEGPVSVVGSLGVGAGLELALMPPRSTGARAYLTMGMRWLRGGEVAYDRWISSALGSQAVRATYATTTVLYTLGIAVDADLWASIDNSTDGGGER